jgi:hypothetical protein
MVVALFACAGKEPAALPDGPARSWRKLSVNGQGVPNCAAAALCAFEVALLNHSRWPDGINDGSGNDHEPDMLDFMKTHPWSRRGVV